MKILFVCLGNICRSPLAEGILRAKVAEKGLDWEIDSAGTNGLHCGEAPHILSRKVAAKNDIDISRQISRKLDKSDFENYDVLYAMAEDVMQSMIHIGGQYFNKKKCIYFLAEKENNFSMNVPDPWYGEEDGYDEVYTIIKENCEAIIQKYNGIQKN